MKLKSINASERLYLIEAGAGFTCYGFDVLDDKARSVATWIAYESSALSAAARLPYMQAARAWRAGPAIGSPEHFAACAAVLAAGARFNAETGKRCDADLVPALIGLEGKRIEADYFGERVRFNVGRSTGWLPAHLRIHNRRSIGGEVLIADAVKNVRVIR